MIRCRAMVMPLMALVLSLVSCGQGESSEPGAAFKMTVLGQTQCEPDATATTCLRVRIVNLGDATGDGFCRPRVTETAPSGEDVSVFGDKIELHAVSSGDEVVRIVAWTKQLPEPPAFVGYCEPGLRA